MVHLIWRLGDDPDNIAIPYLTAIGDLIGTAFLAVAFHLLYLIGDKDADVGEWCIHYFDSTHPTVTEECGFHVHVHDKLDSFMAL